MLRHFEVCCVINVHVVYFWHTRSVVRDGRLASNVPAIAKIKKVIKGPPGKLIYSG